MAPRCTLLRSGVVAYERAREMQERIAEGVRAGDDPALILLEHPPTYTLGARGAAEHLLLSEAAYLAKGAEVHRSDRGGDVTFHGPGQIVGYPIMNIRERGLGPVAYVRALEALLIDALAAFGVEAGRSERGAGVWAGNAKLAAIGVRISRGVTTHGFALNVNTDLSYFGDIVPCGLADARVTSIRELTGATFSMGDVEREIAAAFGRAFGFDMFEGDASEWVAPGGTCGSSSDDTAVVSAGAARAEVPVGR